jgi:hypothetical protein
VEIKVKIRVLHLLVDTYFATFLTITYLTNVIRRLAADGSFYGQNTRC